MIIDMHVHEKAFSPDSVMSLEEAVAAARSKGLDGLCITDHESMGIRMEAEACSQRTGFPLFVGVELATRQGDIVAFGLHTLPSTRRPQAQEVIDHVNRQGGFCFSAHPFRSFGGGLDMHLFQVQGLHGVEVYNGRNDKEDNAAALDVCRRLGLIPLAGSDAHRAHEIGIFATEFPELIDNEAALLDALRSGKGVPVASDGKGSFFPLP